ncbi:uL30 family ribosomal protein [Candidatus Woesearchaeota archaeon]|nr:uL30 family ribosomal protein [Candidatus Woesearchaeota archaeon]
MKKIAVIKIRGAVQAEKRIEDTLKMLGLKKKHSCVVIDDSPSNLGMVQKVKDFITWGTVSEETLKELTEKKGKEGVFRLSPPAGGFERKGIKKPYAKGGALGDRGEKIDLLIKKMLR